MLMSAEQYRESLRAYTPRVFLNGQAVTSVADEPGFLPGINAVGVTYDYALREDTSDLLTATQSSSGETVNRMLHINRHTDDLLTKLDDARQNIRAICGDLAEAVRLEQPLGPVAEWILDNEYLIESHGRDVTLNLSKPFYILTTF